MRAFWIHGLVRGGGGGCGVLCEPLSVSDPLGGGSGQEWRIATTSNPALVAFKS